MSIDDPDESTADMPDLRSNPMNDNLLSAVLQEAPSVLNPREKEIVQYLIEGRDIGEIARSLNVTEKTAYNLISLIRQQVRARLFAI